MVAAADPVEDFYNRELDSDVDKIINDVCSKNVDTLSSEYVKAVSNEIIQAVFQLFDFDGDFDNASFDDKLAECVRECGSR